MMDRRAFLRTASLAAAAAVSLRAADRLLGVSDRIAPSLPTIYGDGVQDDTAGLQALFDGRPFRDMSGHAPVAPDGSVSIHGGSYRFTRTLHLGFEGQPPAVVTHCNFFGDFGGFDGPVLHFHAEASPSARLNGFGFVS